jgi:polyisoprenoid-binding protein YceI
MRPIHFALPLLLLTSGCVLFTTAKPETQNLSGGAYKMDKAHASLIWRVKHQGLSSYTARLTDFDISLDFDPANVAASHVKAIINPLSVSAEHPTDKDWNRRIGEDFLKGKDFPQIVFTSTRIEKTSETTGKMTGDLSFMGVTRPVTLDVTYNGHATSPLRPGKDLVGFSVHGTFSRSAFGSDAYASIASDNVEIIIEAEFVHS